LISPSRPPYLNKRRFGLTYIDFKPQKRTPKLSAEWSHEAAFCNGVV
jgi:beta-glucosidase/6-phospho-beta-glucosidase/beta-galactosidase